MKKSLPHIGVALAALCLAGPAAAQSITEDTPFDFGRWVITNNSSQHTITVQTNGSYSNSPELIPLTNPQPGVYTVTGLPSFATINNVMISPVSPVSGPGGQSFIMDNFTFICPNANFDGETNLTIGARARMSGNGQPYANGAYQGQLNVVIDF